MPTDRRRPNSSTPSQVEPTELFTPRRRIDGVSAILLPLHENDQVDWPALRRHIERTYAAGLTPAVNMDTGFVNLIDASTRTRVLQETRQVAQGRRFVAGVFVGDSAGVAYDGEAYRRLTSEVVDAAGTPIVFQSHGLVELQDPEICAAYEQIARECDEFLFFELGTMFAPFGRIYSLDLYQQLMMLPKARGAKHSSLSRELEWQRLDLRNRIRPEFQVFTGNDLAIDMVMYGSDYLLGLSTFAPEAFARRDALWTAGDSRFYGLNDLLQYLGAFAFRDPTPAYKHSAAMFLRFGDHIDADQTHSRSPRRPSTDREILALIAADLDRQLSEIG